MTIHPSEDQTDGETFKYQNQLPKLPIPELEDTVKRYLAALKPLQEPEDHERTNKAVQDFLKNEGPALQEKLKTYATDKSSYIEEFWYDAYLHYTDPVVLNLNPFFLLEDDPTPLRNDQVIRASSLIYSTLTFIHALETKHLEPDVIRGTPLCMSQFNRLFSTARVPTDNGCYMKQNNNNGVMTTSRHIVVMARSQFYHFQVLDAESGNVLITEKEIAANLRAIVRDADTTPATEIAKNAVGILTTEKRLNWARLRQQLKSDATNRDNLHVVDTALFIVCLDHVKPTSSEELSNNMLCGTYSLEKGLQVGTCTNRWYDKLQIIVCQNGSAGINFEHTGVDGHTVLRYVSDIYTDTILRFAKTINSQTKSIFHNYRQTTKEHPRTREENLLSDFFDHNPRKIEWNITEEIEFGIRFAETRLSDLILQNEVKVLEFDDYGKYFITDMKMSPDAFVQMAFQAAYYGLYGKVECTYEPAMTKSFLHGRTEAIRSVTADSKKFVQDYYSTKANDYEKLNSLRNALKTHTKITRECSIGQGQDRHLYALECVWDRLYKKSDKKPQIFADKGWSILNNTVVSTSNCGNPALRLFGFGPVVSNGFGIGYIIKDDRISFVASSKHRQTERFLQTLGKYLYDIKNMLMKEKYPGGVSQRQRILALEEQEYQLQSDGYSYFDNGFQAANESSSLSDCAGSSTNDTTKTSLKIGKRLVLCENDD